MTFENKIVNVKDFLELLLIPQLKAFILFAIAVVVINYCVGAYGQRKQSSIFKIPPLIWLLFKMFAYGFLGAVVFFFNFEVKRFMFDFPETMLLSTLFVGVLAFYETISILVEIIRTLISE